MLDIGLLLLLRLPGALVATGLAASCALKILAKWVPGTEDGMLP
jgi:hypothetical protein